MGDKAPTLEPPVVPLTPVTSAIDHASEKPGLLAPVTHNPLAHSIRDVYRSFNARRSSLGLTNPGTVEDISREVTRDVFLKNLMFSGFRAELNKAFSSSPLFQTAHTLAMGGNGNMPPYGFAALYGSPRIFMQGNIDSEFSLNSRLNYRPFSALTLRNSLQLSPSSPTQPQGSMVSFEANYKGQDFSVDLKAMNPSVLDSNSFTGILVGSYLQSVTPRLALGLETMWQRQTGDEGPQAVTSYAGRYNAGSWIGSAQLLPTQGVVQGSYWRRLSEQVDVGLDLNLSLMGTLSGAAGGGAPLGPMMGQLKNEGTATMGAKYMFRTGSTFRGQVDSSGKVAAVLEKRLAPMVQFTFAGEMDHAKNASKIGMAVQIESVGSDEFLEQQERAQQAAAQTNTMPPTGDVHPF